MNRKETTLRMPITLDNFITAMAKRQGISCNALITQEMWKWQKSLKRTDLLKFFSEDELTELEIKLYAEKKQKINVDIKELM